MTSLDHAFAARPAVQSAKIHMRANISGCGSTWEIQNLVFLLDPNKKTKKNKPLLILSYFIYIWCIINLSRKVYKVF